jgi:hypothetical protein
MPDKDSTAFESEALLMKESEPACCPEAVGVNTTLNDWLAPAAMVKG